MADHPRVCLRCGRALAADQATVCPACHGAPKAPTSASRGEMADPLVGQFLDEFQILEPLGGGPTGQVYKARQTSLDRLVSVKVLPETAARDHRRVARLRREADAAAAVSHPNVIEVHAVGRQADHHFIAMELVPGESLADILERGGRLPGDRVLALMRQVADALVSVHAAGIRHCDIRPSSLLVTAEGRVKLTGFGLARRAGEATGRRAANSALDTPLYFPPEAARGKPLDERSDLYLLGATFYHALAGRAPFEGGSAEERALQYARKEVPRLDRIVPTAPVALCRSIHRLLRRKPDARYQSAQELLEALDRIGGAIARSQSDAPRRGLVPPSRGDRRESTAEPLALAERAEARRRQERQVILLSGAALLIVLIVVLLLFGLL